jgi:ATP-dependent DNA helicase RecG
MTNLPVSKLGKVANRLLIGDVGSGKTLVAVFSLLTYLDSIRQDESISKDTSQSFQVAFLAPTDVLVNQHFEQLQKIKQVNKLDWLDLVCVTQKNIYLNEQKINKKTLSKYLEGQQGFSCWVGTQALFFLKNFDPLMVVADEQQRFGVRQRQLLADKTEANQVSAHFISMSATPIPRTLALTMFGGLETSYIKRIKDRQAIVTEIIQEADLPRIKNIIRQQLEIGRKIYVICPAVDNSDKEEIQDQNLWDLPKAEKWVLEQFGNLKTFCIHGKNKEKNQILADFKNHSAGCALISTTVIEVGVDVSEASMMIVLNPERFGLSQLHQIRGRVGRNRYADNYCWLYADSEQRHIPRLKFLCKSQDGFEIAQEDLRLRGQGDLAGVTQSGNIDEFYGLKLEEYQEIASLVDQIDFGKEDELPILKEYLDHKISKVWTE